MTLIFNEIIGTKFEENCVKQDEISRNHREVVNLFIVYKLDTRPRYLSTDFALDDCLFEAVKLSKNVCKDKYSYSGIGLDARWVFPFPIEWVR